MIYFEDVTKVYKTVSGTRVVLDGFTGAILRGQRVGILGQNGAGKSTLIRLIAGVEAPTDGRIRRTVQVSFPLGFSGTFAGALSGRENAVFLARIYGADPAAVVDAAAEFAELGTYFDMPVNSYSSGMRARLAFGVSMAIDFDVYLVDEVMGVGDVRFRERCRVMLSERFQHSDLIMVSHSPVALRQFCNVGAVLHNGRLTVYPSIDEAQYVHAEQMRRPA